MAADARRLAGAALAEALRDARATTLARTLDLDDEGWRVPEQAGVNPVAWELGHVAWFAEFWILRGPHRRNAAGFVDAARPAALAGPDAVFDSARLAHAERWRVALLSRAELIERLDLQLAACVNAIARDEDDDDANYFHRLALFHEDMHGEAFAWLRATLGRPAPTGIATLPHLGQAEELTFARGDVALGRDARARGFAFDNEQPVATVGVAPFSIDSAPVRNAEFVRFVAAGGYDDPALWPGEAGRWRAGHARAHPARWRPEGEGWQLRWFDRWLPLDPEAPVIHVSAFEAEAFCRFVGRRLPHAAEWELATQDARFRWGQSVWEWTADAFLPYPGFVAGPYADYSAPWFGDHRETRGGAFATHARLHDPRYRNFFVAGRTDVFAGFRTAAPVR
ncbi:MAG: SUMF1/EgtB/PvdO family nonheme iron enzyme [Rhizobacter sp.]|nr:SUMF1/EgtB/PvdO family nonheme iron enzyme [Rhizobacter sp.]